MIEKKDVEKLAALARITIPENEIEKVRKDIESILAYVDHINEATDLAGTNVEEDPVHSYTSGVKNVMREDGQPHESGIYTKAILANAPKSQDGYVKVKKILS